MKKYRVYTTWSFNGQWGKNSHDVYATDERDAENRALAHVGSDSVGKYETAYSVREINED